MSKGQRGQDLLLREDGYVTAAEVAEATGKALATVHRAIQAGTMPGEKVGSGWYVDIYALIESGEYPAEGPGATIRTRLDALAKLVARRATGAPKAAPARRPTT